MWQFTIASMVIGAYIGREYPFGTLCIFGLFMIFLALLIINPAAGAALILLIILSAVGLVMLPVLIGYGLGMTFIYFFIIGLGQLVK